MSRSGYHDDNDDNWQLIRWRGAVRSAIRGKRGQAFLKEMLAALDAMPDKRLIAGVLVVDGWQGAWDGQEIIVGADELVDRRGQPHPMGAVCAIGAVGKARGVDMAGLDPEDSETVSCTFGISDALAREIVYMNDEGAWNETPEQRWARMRRWVAAQIKM